MNNQISIYNFNNNKIRTKIFDSKIYFCGKDVCEAIAIKNSKDALQRLTKGVVTADLLTAGGVQQAKFIDEPNLYKIVLQSRKPQAEPFVNWVCNEVLPSIRQTGCYAAPARNDTLVEVREHTRSLPSGKKEIVLSDKVKTEIGGIVKSCTAVAIRDELKLAELVTAVAQAVPDGKISMRELQNLTCCIAGELKFCPNQTAQNMAKLFAFIYKALTRQDTINEQTLFAIEYGTKTGKDVSRTLEIIKKYHSEAMFDDLVVE